MKMKTKQKQNQKAKQPKCIMCNGQKEGITIKADSVVNALRWLNSHTVKYENPTRSVVCRECFPKYMKRRRSYETKLVAYLVIGFLFAAFIVIASRANPVSFLFGFGVIVVMYLLSLISYMPPLDVPKQVLSESVRQGKKPSDEQRGR